MGTFPGDQNTDRAQREMSFESLIKLARDGNEGAVGTLIDRYRNYLLMIANEDVGQELKAKIGASDAVQESMMHAHFNFQQFKGNSEPELKAWLRTILGNDIRKNHRKFSAQKRDADREINIQEQSAVARSLVDRHLTPSGDAVHKEKERAMAMAMSQLSADQQQVIRLRNYDQLSFEEIGHVMDRNPEAARKYWARAIEALKASLRTIAPELVDPRVGKMDDE